MKKLFVTAAVVVMAMTAMAQTTNYEVRWANHPISCKGGTYGYRQRLQRTLVKVQIHYSSME